MNTDTLKGKWNQLKGDLKTKWGKITDDEWTQIAGDKDKLVGKIQERYGRSKDEVSRDLDQFLMQHDQASTKQHSGQSNQGHQNAGNPADMNQPGKRKVS